MQRLARRPHLTVLGLILFSVVVLAVAGLIIDETTTMNPVPIIGVAGAIAGAGLMTLAKRIDQRNH